MSPEKLAFINLITRVGFEAAALIWENVGKATTIDDAIAALRATQALTAADYARSYQPVTPVAGHVQ